MILAALATIGAIATLGLLAWLALVAWFFIDLRLNPSATPGAEPSGSDRSGT